MKNKIKYSVIIIAEEKNDSLHDYLRSLEDIFNERKELYEIILIQNGVTDKVSAKDISDSFLHTSKEMNILAFNKKVPQSVCFNAGLKQSKGEYLITSDNYQQISSESINHLLDNLDKDTDVVVSHRQNRIDPKINQIQSKWFNGIVKKLTNVELNDINSSFKIFKKYIFESVVVYGNMYRFLPIVCQKKGFAVKEVNCTHFKETGPTGVYAISKYLNRIIDIFILYFITSSIKKPLRLFSKWGAYFIIASSILMFFTVLQKTVFNIPLGNNYFLLLSIVCIFIGVHVFSFGLLGEMITFIYGRKEKDYTIDKIV